MTMAGDGMLRVDFGAMRQGSADIQKALNTLQAQLDQLEQDAAPLVSTWAGDAREAYEERQAKWRTASRDLHQILHNIKKAIDHSTDDYIATERRAASRFQ
jgi:6 kDa early secretory antigenic target